MDEKAIKTIKTSCPFPMLSYQAKVRYNEVKKASGIAFILLELMQRSAMKDEKVTEILLRFGIPADMHYLFAKELVSLVRTEIVSVGINPAYLNQPEYFEQMRLGEFSLTEKGVKMFAEGAIPTGEEKAKTAQLFYRPATRKFEYYCTDPYALLETSFLGENFLDRISYDVSDMEDFISGTKDKVGLKKEEHIVDITYEEPQKLAVKSDENLTIEIYSDGVAFKLRNTDEQAFFDEYYSPSLMTSGMLAKEKYKFAVDVPTVDIEACRFNNLYIPDETKKQAQKPCEIYLDRGRLRLERTDNVLRFDGCGALLDLLDQKAEFALLNLTGCKYYSPVNLKISDRRSGEAFEIQMLGETVADHSEFEQLLHAILEDCYDLTYTPEIGRIIRYIAEVEHDPEYLQGYVSHMMSKASNDESRIELLVQFNDEFGNTKAWAPFFAELSKELFDRCVKTVELDNILSKYAEITPLSRAMGLSESEFVTRFSEQIRDHETPELVYQALESVGLKESVILPVANIIAPLMEQVLNHTVIDGTTELAGKYAVLSSNHWKLCEMLGIEDLTDYSLRDDYNVDDYFNAYATFESAKKEIERYRIYAQKQYDLIDRYNRVFDMVHEVHSIERTAAEHPDKITRKFIDEQISRGRYSVAISNLLIKAQYDLRQLLSVDQTAKANELIDLARESGMIDHKRADDLHQLRMCRNGFQHPEARQISFDKTKLEEWKEIVFSLKGDKEQAEPSKPSTGKP